MVRLHSVRSDLLLLRSRVCSRWSESCSNEAALLPTPWQPRSVSMAWPHAVQKFIQIPAAWVAETTRRIQNRARIEADMLMLSISKTLFNGYKDQLQHKCETQAKETKIISLEDLSQCAGFDDNAQVRAQVWDSDRFLSHFLHFYCLKLRDYESFWILEVYLTVSVRAVLQWGWRWIKKSH